MTAGLCFLSPGEGEIRCEQLNMVTKWIGDFQAANRQPDEDVVFDVLCGDFNFDNCSPGVFPTTLYAFVILLHNIFFFWKHLHQKLVFCVYICFSVCLDDTLEQNHCLFEEYRDPCRAGPGKEKPWVIGVYNFKLLDYSIYCVHTRQIMTMHWVFHWYVSKGTLLEQPTLYEDDINTPENLQRYTQFYFCFWRHHC